MKNVFIVEDAAVSRAALESLLTDNSYHIVGSTAKAETALDLLPGSNADILLLDINLAGKKDGIWLAAEIRKLMNIPIVYLTAYGDAETLQNLRLTNPDGYIMKPYNEPTLITTMNIAMENFNRSVARIDDRQTAGAAANANFLFIRIDGQKKKIGKEEILYIRSGGNYLRIQTAEKFYLLREKLETFLEKLADPRFIRVHRRFAVNKNHIDSFNSREINIGGEQIVISKTYRDIVDMLGGGG